MISRLGRCGLVILWIGGLPVKDLATVRYFYTSQLHNRSLCPP